MPHSPLRDINLINLGPLSDLTFVVKDMCEIKGFKSSCGNPDFYEKC